ncbi:MAG: hypothetical protein ACRERV_08145 [Methylococcales bacterium]
MFGVLELRQVRADFREPFKRGAATSMPSMRAKSTPHIGSSKVRASKSGAFWALPPRRLGLAATLL